MSPVRRWGIPSLLVSTSLHGALVGSGLLSGLQAPAARQSELPASVAMAGSSVEVDATTETVAAPSTATQIEAEGVTEAASAVAPRQNRAAPRAARATRAAPRSPATVAPISSANVSAAELSAIRASGLSPRQWPVRAVLSLGYAVARALPLAAPADAAWGDLPVGHVGTIRIELSVDERNCLHAARLIQAKPDEPAPPAVLAALFERALLLMREGKFVLSTSHQPGAEQLAIAVAIRARATDEQGADTVVEKAFSGATPALPGRAYFRYGTGREVEATVTVLRAEP